MAATLEKPSLRFKRHYAVPVEKVFRAWTDPQALKQWFGPSNDSQILVSETDLKVGGRYRIVMQMPSGEQHRVGGVYREVVPDECSSSPGRGRARRNGNRWSRCK